MRLLISFAALFFSVILLQLSTGGVGPLDVLSGLQLDFSRQEIGMLGSAHFLGFFIGCWWAPRLMGSVGHSRAFAAFTAAGSIGLMAHMMVLDPYAWGLMRVASGMCVAGCYTVIEAWMQAKVTNESRGRTMGVYRVVDMSGSLAAQWAHTLPHTGQEDRQDIWQSGKPYTYQDLDLATAQVALATEEVYTFAAPHRPSEGVVVD